MHYVCEYGGGLGDVLAQLYFNGSYNVFRDMAPEDTADIYIVCHNPHAQEIFDYHPKRSQMTIHAVGYWDPPSDKENREKFKLPPPGSLFRMPRKDNSIIFYPSPEEKPLIDSIMKDEYIMIAASAGQPARVLPDDMIKTIVDYLLENTDYKLVPIGRSFERQGRYEPLFPDHPRIINCVEKLTVPGTARLVQSCTGMVTSHSAMNLLGFTERIPQLLLYPQDVLDRHLKDGKYDAWSYGFTFPEIVHTLFENFTVEHIKQFLEKL